MFQVYFKDYWNAPKLEGNVRLPCYHLLPIFQQHKRRLPCHRSWSLLLQPLAAWFLVRHSTSRSLATLVDESFTQLIKLKRTNPYNALQITTTSPILKQSKTIQNLRHQDPFQVSNISITEVFAHVPSHPLCNCCR